MSTYQRPRLGEVRNLTNRNNIAAAGFAKPALLDGKNRPLYSKKINDENQEVVKHVGAKNATKPVVDVSLIKKVASLSTNNAPRSKIPVFGSKPEVKPAAPKQSSNALQPLHPVITPNMRIENIDTDKNIFVLGEYADDIYNYLFNLEKNYALKTRFMREYNQGFTESTRGVLVNWICSVHSKYTTCTNETLYLTVSIIDHYLAKKTIPKERLQLLGATSFFVASKFEEIYYPDVRDIVSLCDDLYNKKDVLNMELDILKTLDFALAQPLTIHFLRRGSKAAHSTSSMHMMSKYLCELSLLDYEISGWAASLTAAVALYITLRMFEANQPSGEGDRKSEKIWNQTIEYYTNYTHGAMLNYAPYMCRAIVKAETSRFQNVRKKYADSRYLKTSTLPMLSSTFIRQFAAQLDSPRGHMLKK